ncbi:DUF7260 family protein [Natrinema gelatinilyticum]|uniref:DUF7260 family protein n=1 Tax=Natrinema gelatinilyticum TaxID=2961571 RepID=UPI0020C43669|nr:hypothetical protein [Natrinema gelatinilyticum]
MSVRTPIHHARDRVNEERNHVREKRTSFETFARLVRRITARSVRHPPDAPAVTDEDTFAAPTISCAPRVDSSEDGCKQVREAFAETVRPHSVRDLEEPEPLAATIEEEFGPDCALALASKTPTRFTASTKRAVLAAVAERTTELAAMGNALESEAESLDVAADVVEDCTSWLVEANETPLPDLGFDELRTRHETLSRYRTRCDDLARDRQSFLSGTTNPGPGVGMTHQELAAYLYAAFPVDYPVLATCVRLERICRNCQRAVRDHLVRRA